MLKCVKCIAYDVDNDNCFEMCSKRSDKWFMNFILNVMLFWMVVMCLDVMSFK